MWIPALYWVSACFAATCLSVFAFLIVRRKHQPLRFRAPWMVLFTGLGAFSLSAWLLLFLLSLRRAEDDIRTTLFSHRALCTAGGWVFYLGYVAMVVPYILRSYRLYAIFHIRNVEKLSENPRFWHTLVMKESYLVKLLLVSMALVGACRVAADLLDFNLGLVGFTCDSDTLYAWLSLHVVEAVLLGYIVYRLRSVRDDYAIASELTAVCVIWILSTVAAFVVTSLDRGSSEHRWFAGDGLSISHKDALIANALVILARNTGVIFVSLVWPLKQTFSDPYVPLWSNCDALRSLDSLLRDIVCIQYYRAYLTALGRVQNILAWVEIELYRDLYDAEDLRIQAARIFNKYLRPGAELEVKVTREARNRVGERLDRGVPTPDLFAEVQHALFILMNADFPQFLASESCRQCVRELETEEHLRAILVESDMIAK